MYVVCASTVPCGYPHDVLTVIKIFVTHQQRRNADGRKHYVHHTPPTEPKPRFQFSEGNNFSIRNCV